MKILFYVEPAIFRGNPTFFSPHVNNIRCFINANRGEGVEFGLLTSPVLLAEYDVWLQHGGENDLVRFAISGRRLIESFDFDLFKYSQYLYGKNTIENLYLDQVCKAVAARFSPDLILSFTQNIHLQRLFPAARVGFCEVGPLPRRDGRSNFYFDFGGHGSDSILSRHLDGILANLVDGATARDLAAKWLVRFGKAPHFASARAIFEDWRRDKCDGRKIALLAHSPPSYPSYGGVAVDRSADSLTASVLTALPDGWVGIPTYHREMFNSGPMEAFFVNEFPAFRALPAELRGLGSDPFLPLVDGVVTVASKTGFSAALHGKQIVSLGSSLISGLACDHVSGISRARQLTDEDVGKLIAFMSNRFVLSFEDCFQNQGKLVAFLREILMAGDPISAQLDMIGWCPKKAAILM